MDRFIHEISSLYWWIGVVIVGIVINIASSYIKKIMESSLSGVSSYWERKQTKRAAKIAKKIEILKGNSELRVIYALRESRYRIRALSFFISAILLMAMGSLGKGYVSVAFFVFGSIGMLVSLDDHREAMKIANLVERSTDGLRELDA